MNTKSIRALIVGITGILTATGVLPESLSEAVVTNAEAVVGGVMVIWSAFTVERIRAEKKVEK